MKRFGKFMLLSATFAIVLTSCMKDRMLQETQSNYTLKEYDPPIHEIIPLVQDFKKSVEQYKKGMKSTIEDKSPEEALWLMEAAVNYEYKHPLSRFTNVNRDSVEFKAHKYVDVDGKVKLDGNDIASKYLNLSQAAATIIGNDKLEVANASFKDVSEINDNRKDSVSFIVHIYKGDATPRDNGDGNGLNWDLNPLDTTCLDIVFDANGTMIQTPRYITVCDDWYALSPGRCDGQNRYPHFAWEVMEEVINYNYQNDFIAQIGGATSQVMFYTGIKEYGNVQPGTSSLTFGGHPIIDYSTGNYAFINPDGTYANPSGFGDFSTFVYASSAASYCITDNVMKSRVNQVEALITALKGISGNSFKHFISVDIDRLSEVNIQNYYAIRNAKFGTPVFY